MGSGSCRPRALTLRVSVLFPHGLAFLMLGFLDSGTGDIWGWITLCVVGGGHRVERHPWPPPTTCQSPLSLQDGTTQNVSRHLQMAPEGRQNHPGFRGARFRTPLLGEQQRGEFFQVNTENSIMGLVLGSL